MKFTNFENQLLDIMRSTNTMAIDPAEQLKGTAAFSQNSGENKSLISACPKIIFLNDNSSIAGNTVKILNIRTPQIFAVITLKFE